MIGLLIGVLQIGLVMGVVWFIIYLIANLGSLINGDGLIGIKEFLSITAEVNRSNKGHREEKHIAIGKVIPRKGYIYVYDENNKQLFFISSGDQPNEGLRGYTNNTVNIQRGNYIYTYDPKGNQLGFISAGN